VTGRLRLPLWLLTAAVMLLSGCGYHLVGHGDGTGAIPADVHAVALLGNDAAREVLPLLRDRLQQAGYDLNAEQAEATLRVALQPEGFAPSAYDRAGVATQYRMAIAGSLVLEQDGAVIWQSGDLAVQDEIYVTAGPASIEASRQRFGEQLRNAWVHEAWSRLQSGF